MMTTRHNDGRRRRWSKVFIVYLFIKRTVFGLRFLRLVVKELNRKRDRFDEKHLGS
jgi:hypothetical protein